LEACQDRTKSEGGALKNEPRKAKSVGKDGKPDNSKDGFGPNGDEGMGWFPGYAINIETGERLNIMFSENSDMTLNSRFGSLINGADMLFNPTSTYALHTEDLGDVKAGTTISKELHDFYFTREFLGPDLTGEITLKMFGIERVWGGMHYIYVCNSAGNTSSAYYMNRPDTTKNSFLDNARRNFNLRDTTLKISYYQYNRVPPGLEPTFPSQPVTYGPYIDAEGKYPQYDCGPYDEGRWLVQKFKQFVNMEEKNEEGYTDPNPTNAWHLEQNKIPHSYRRNYKMQLFNNVMYTHIPMQPDNYILKEQWMSGDVTYKIRVTRPYLRYASRWFENPNQRDYKDNIPPELDNHGFPVYKVSTKNQAPVHHDTRVYQKVLDGINIVPNPYYGGSLYERNPLETKVKIINLPTDLLKGQPVTINIFTVNGILVRTLTKGDSETAFVDWDLKNFANIPIAGGVYIIHVNCPGIGERMLKFFCTMRPTDLNAF
jgi:hypothetical protein